MKHGVILSNAAAGENPYSLVECAVAAEEAGWDGVFLFDHLVFPPPPTLDASSGHDTDTWEPPQFMAVADPWITLSAIAVRTRTIKLGSWITPVPRRQPWQFARDLATVDRLSNGRVILGTGLGRRSEYERFGTSWDAKELGKKYDEALELINRFWSGERVSFHGKYFRVDDVALLPTPIQQPRIPIVVAGIWPNRKPFQRAARWDGLMPHFHGDGIVPGDGNEVPEREVTALMEYYHSLTDAPGDVFLPAEPPNRSPSYAGLCEDVGVTWLYSIVRDESGQISIDPERYREGPLR